MNDTAAPPPPPDPGPEALQRLWLAALYQSLAFLAVLVLLTQFVEFGGLHPKWGQYAFGLGLLSAAPALGLHVRLRALRRHTPPWRQRHPEYLARLRRLMLAGIALADLPAMGGFVYYVLAAQFWPMVVLCLASSLLIYAFQPAPPPAHG